MIERTIVGSVPTSTNLPTTAAAASAADVVAKVDGRRARGARNKNAVVSALLELYESGDVQPSAARIAALAGVSERSVFRYFDDMEDLVASAVVIQWERVLPYYRDLPAEGTFDERLRAIIDHRLALHDKVGGVFRVAMVAALRIGAAAEAVEQRREFLRRQTRRHFGPEIERHTAKDATLAERVATIVDATLSLENIDYLRRSCRLDDAAVKSVLETGLRAALESA